MTSTSPAPRSTVPSSRVEWIDGARGCAMLLLLVWHAAAIPDVLGIAMPAWVRTANDGLHLVRMPLLMFLSGMVAHQSLRRPLRVYYRRKAATLAWPYLLWGLLDLLTFEHADPSEPMAWDGAGYLWFLWFVIVFSAVAPLARRVPPLAIAAVSLAAATTAHLTFPDDDLLSYGTYFFTGVAAAASPALFARLTRSTPLVLACAAGGVVACVAWSADVRANEGFYVPFVLGGVVATSAVLSRVPRFPAIVDAVGRRSIVWYLAHFPVMHLTVVLVRRVDPGLPWAAYLVIDLVAASVVCTLLTRWSRRPPTRWLFSVARG